MAAIFSFLTLALCFIFNFLAVGFLDLGIVDIEESFGPAIQSFGERFDGVLVCHLLIQVFSGRVLHRST